MRELVLWRDTLFVCGTFLDHPDTSVFYYSDGEFHPYGHVGEGAYRLRVIEDTLFVVGTFETVDGYPTCGVAKRVGNQWIPIGVVASIDNFLSDIIEYQGELIVVGIGPWENGRHAIYHLVDDQWELLGDALSGLNSRPNIMCEYQGLLYFGGQIRMADGNIGHGLIAWNGSEYLNVGGGLTWAPNDFYTLTGITALEVHDDLLFVSGGFFYAGDQPTQGLVTWDGTRWCDVQGDFMGPLGGNYVNDMAFAGDSLYIASTGEVDGMEGFFAAAAAVSHLPGACQDVSVLESHIESTRLLLTPNPASHEVLLSTTAPVDARIQDSYGRVVWSARIPSMLAIDISDWAPGTYVVRHSGGAQKLVVAR